MYVTNNGHGTVSVIDATTRAVWLGYYRWLLGPRTSPTIQMGTGCMLSNGSDDSVSVIDTATNAVTATISVPILPDRHSV